GWVGADQLPAEPAGFLDDLGVMVSHLAVQRRAGADAIPRQHFHYPPDADAVAIVAHRPVPHVRDLSVLARHPLVEVTRHHDGICPRKAGSHRTPRWRKPDSNFRS